MPADPYGSKKADCGLNTATCGPRASTMPRAQRSRPAGGPGQAPGVQQAGMRVDADAQRPAFGDRLASRAPYGVGHRVLLGHAVG